MALGFRAGGGGYNNIAPSGEYVEVVADGVKTDATLLNELYNLIDPAKINPNTKFMYFSDANTTFIGNYTRKGLHTYVFEYSYSSSGSTYESESFFPGDTVSTSHHYKTTITSSTTHTTLDTQKPTAGKVYRVVY